MKISIVNLGCKVNQAEGEDLLNGFRAVGYEDAGRDEAADIIIVNTCTVTNEADRKSRKAINRACKTVSGTTRPLVVVTGCYAAIAAEELEKIEGVSVVVPQADKSNLVEEVLLSVPLDGQTKGVPAKVRQKIVAPPPKPGSGLDQHSDIYCTPSKRVRAFLKVQDGCDNRCAYCIVPDARGNPVSVPVATVHRCARALADSGAREIVLTGINVGKFKEYKEYEDYKEYEATKSNIKEYDNDLCSLVARILAVPGVLRVRISSIEPEDVTLDLINMLATPNSLTATPYLCPHLHIPLQSGNRRVLQRMGRRYTPSDFLRLCNTIRFAVPDAAITTDVIVGFPGETEEEFASTMMLLEQTKPSRIHVFKYSKRAGTPAAEMPDQVPDDVKTARSEAVRALGDRLAAEYRDSFIGKELDVLVEREKDGLLIGTTENYLSVSIPGSKADIGKIVKHRLG